MKFVWVDHGADFDTNKAQAHGVNGAFFALDEQPASVIAKAKKARMEGYAAGVYLGHGWAPFNWGDGVLLGEQVAEMVKSIFGIHLRPSFPKVQLDIETHDPVFVMDALEAFRSHLPKQDLSWTMEPFQGGWMAHQGLRDAIVRHSIRVVPQAYFGGMQRVAEDQVLRDLTRVGYDERRVSLFYDGAQLPREANGFIFTQARLP